MQSDEIGVRKYTEIRKYGNTEQSH